MRRDAQEMLSMKAFILSVAAIGLVVSPVLAAPVAKTTKTMATKAGGAKATTTVTTKVTPTSSKGTKQARVKPRKRSNAMAAKVVKKPAQSAKKSG
jgi:hypothetical protein